MAKNKLFTIKECTVTDKKLVAKIIGIMAIYKRNNKCVYADWLAKDLGIPKVAFSLFIMQNIHIFNVDVGTKSDKLIIQSVHNSHCIIDNSYYDKERDAIIKPVAILFDSLQAVTLVLGTEGEIVNIYAEAISSFSTFKKL